MAPLTGLAATDVTLAAPDGTFIEVVKPWRGWQHADGEDWVKVEVDGSSPLLGAFYLAAGGSMLLRATMSILEWLGFEGLYLCLSPADDQGLPRLDAMDQCMLLPNTYLRVKVRALLLLGWCRVLLQGGGGVLCCWWVVWLLGCVNSNPPPLSFPAHRTWQWSSGPAAALPSWTAASTSAATCQVRCCCCNQAARSVFLCCVCALTHRVLPFSLHTECSCQAVGGAAGSGYVHN
jgi:hypothetical protein